MPVVFRKNGAYYQLRKGWIEESHFLGDNTQSNDIAGSTGSTYCSGLKKKV